MSTTGQTEEAERETKLSNWFGLYRTDSPYEALGIMMPIAECEKIPSADIKKFHNSFAVKYKEVLTKPDADKRLTEKVSKCNAAFDVLREAILRKLFHEQYSKVKEKANNGTKTAWENAKNTDIKPNKENIEDKYSRSAPQEDDTNKVFPSGNYRNDLQPSPHDNNDNRTEKNTEASYDPSHSSLPPLNYTNLEENRKPDFIDDIPEEFKQQFASNILDGNMIKAQGFDLDTFQETFDGRSFIGCSVYGIPMVSTMTNIGFIYYFNRAFLLQFLINIIILSIGGNGVVVVPTIILLVLYLGTAGGLYYFYAEDFLNPPADFLPFIRIVMYIIEFIMTCVTIHLASDCNKCVNDGLLACIGIADFWVSLSLGWANFRIRQAYSRRHNFFTESQVAELDTDEVLLRCALRCHIPDLLFYQDSAMNGILTRVSMWLVSFVAYFIISLALSYDLFIAFFGRRGINTCMTIVAFAFLLKASGDLLTQMTSMIMNRREKAMNAMDEKPQQIVMRFRYAEVLHFCKLLVLHAKIHIYIRDKYREIYSFFCGAQPMPVGRTNPGRVHPAQG